MLIIKRKLAALGFGLLCIAGSAIADEWVRASLVSAGAVTYAQGNRFRECTYKVPGTNVVFSITTTDFNCPSSIQYNMVTKQWQG